MGAPQQQAPPAANQTLNSDPIADNMLLYQRKNGGFKHFRGDKKWIINMYLLLKNSKNSKWLRKGIDVTIDNEATTKEIKYLVKAYKSYNQEAF